MASTEEGCISSVGAFDEGLILTSSTFTDSSRYTMLDPSLASPPKIFHSSSPPNIYSSQVSEICYSSTDGQKIHAFVVTPQDFNPVKKYPLIFLIHGGPQYAWQDDFPIEGIYNPLVFAAAGYVVFLPNITGSIGYGQKFTDSIRGQWGGKPYTDLESGFKYIKDNLKFADTERGVAPGGSWGAYMVNWLAGQPFGKEFKALVSDSGIFSTKTFASATDEGWFPTHDFESHWWG
jgi:pre-mRNA-splicing helicase BRR2